MRIGIASVGRFHVADLARELAALGHDVRFYTATPPWRARRFGLSDEVVEWLGAPLAPLLLAREAALRAGRGEALLTRAVQGAFDRLLERRLQAHDIFISMAGLATRSLERAKHRDGALTIIERGSRHILSQRAIMQRFGSEGSFDVDVLRRELAEYALVDYIAVPARHVVESFVERGFDPARLLRNPFGVSLDHFRPTPAPSGAPRILMVGTWCFRKGCDVLVEAWRGLKGVELWHVGPVTDCALPSDAGFRHVGPVQQYELMRYYAEASVFCLASREEGLALVQAQALACGLSLVCTTRTGGEDLKELIARPDAIRVVPPDDPAALREALREALAAAPTAGASRDLLGEHQLSWAHYAKRYEAQLVRVLAAR